MRWVGASSQGHKRRILVGVVLVALAVGGCSAEPVRMHTSGGARGRAPSEFRLEVTAMDGRPGYATRIVVDDERATLVGRRGDMAGVFESPVSAADRDEAERILLGLSADQPLLEHETPAVRFVLDARGRHANLLFSGGPPPELWSLVERMTAHVDPVRAFRLSLADLPDTVEARDSVSASVVIENVGTESMALSLEGELFINGEDAVGSAPGVASRPRAWRLGEVQAPSVPAPERQGGALRSAAVLELEPGERAELEVDLTFPEPGRVSAVIWWDGSFSIAGGGESVAAFAALHSKPVMVEVEP